MIGQVLRAKEPPDVRLANNSVYTSADGDCNCMAGGDFDGDSNMLSDNPLLVGLVESTDSWLRGEGSKRIAKHAFPNPITPSIPL